MWDSKFMSRLYENNNSWFSYELIHRCKNKSIIGYIKQYQDAIDLKISGYKRKLNK